MIPFDNSYARLPERFYVRQDPVAVARPELVRLNHTLDKELGINLSGLDARAIADMLAGNSVPEGAAPLAQAYAGHQFGQFVPQLGDGRALLLGEVIDTQGRRRDIQLKGSGQTPFSRRGDGRAALGPVMREYIISEAMHALGIPTTRSLAIVLTGEPVFRETALPGAVLTRIAASHLRIGTFEYFAAREDNEALEILTRYTLERHYPKAASAENTALALLDAVMRAQSKLVAQWLRVGFIHGVMNTDNMALSGETIDYGPCAFMDTYNPETVFSSIDVYGRYAYGNQPAIVQWNLASFAETLLPLIADSIEEAATMAEEKINTFAEIFAADWLAAMGSKFGLTQATREDMPLMQEFLQLLLQHEADYTNSFRALGEAASEGGEERLRGIIGQHEALSAWLARWRKRLPEEDMDKAQALMRNANPAYIPRNHRVEQAIVSATEHQDFSVMEALLEVLATPYAEQQGKEAYTFPPTPQERVYKTFCGT